MIKTKKGVHSDQVKLRGTLHWLIAVEDAGGGGSNPLQSKWMINLIRSHSH